MALACALGVFSFNIILATLFPRELGHHSRVIVAPLLFFFLATLISVVIDLHLHCGLRADQMDAVHFVVHSGATLGCFAIQLLNVWLLWTAKLTWAHLRWTQALDGIVTSVAQLTASGVLHVGHLGALSRCAPPLIAAALMTRDFRCRVAAYAEQLGFHRVCVNLADLPAEALALSQHGHHEIPAREQVVSSSLSSSSLQVPSYHSHETAKLGGSAPCLPPGVCSRYANVL